jgi:DNA polymerase-3 subunit alpha
VFKDRFYLEVQAHDSEGQARHNEQILQLGEALNLPIVATNDAHFLRDTDHDAHDVLLCIGLGKDYADQNRMHYDRGLYFKSAPRWQSRFPQRPGRAGEHSSDRRRSGVRVREEVLRSVVPAAAGGEDRRTSCSCARDGGALERYGDVLSAGSSGALDYELGVITKTGYAGYFLIVYDFIKAARDRTSRSGRARSAAGSIVAYALQITDVCPLKYDLLFERFLNPERVSMPDIDVDFCFERAGEVIEYVRQKYGKESVGQIVTFGTMKSRARSRTSGVRWASPLRDDALAKLIPNGPAFSLDVEGGGQGVPRSRSSMGTIALHDAADYAISLEGLSRHTGDHAAGVVIAPGPPRRLRADPPGDSKGAGAGTTRRRS